MSNTDTFISEVADEVRRERAMGLLQRWGWVLVLLVLGLIGGAVWYEISQARDRSAAEARGDALSAALAVADPTARIAALEALPAGPDTPVARFAAAGVALETGDRAGAAAELAAVASDGAAPEPWRGLAALQRVMILGSELDASERLAVLDGLAAEGAPFRSLALEQRALMRIEAGDRPAAAADLDAILGDPAAPQGLRGRAEQLRAALGVSAAPAASAPAEAPTPAPASEG